MYVNICLFMYTYIACTYCWRLVHKFINMYMHVCTMYIALCTKLHILVHVVRIPDGRYRYIVILTPISAFISMIPDIGVHLISVFTRYRVYPWRPRYESPKTLLTQLYFERLKVFFFHAQFIFPLSKLSRRPTPTIPHRFNEIKLETIIFLRIEMKSRKSRV
jgi:hypothetical protein